jgi:molybdate transport system regulatory protein
MATPRSTPRAVAADAAAPPRLSLRVLLREGEPFGPGKADLLEAISSTGSIAAAARRMGMSYQRAWDLVNAMNGHFREPVIASAKGGVRGGGAILTPFGRKVLDTYREIGRRAEAAAGPQLRWLLAQLAPPGR